MPFMRLPKLLMGALLVLPLACGGDDGGGNDTGGNDGGTSPTGTSAPSTMSMSAGDDGVDDGVDDGADDGMVTGSSSGEPPSDSSGEPPADSSGSGGGSDSGSGSGSEGAASECEMFCAQYFEECGAEPANDYGDEASCVTTCDGYPPPEFMCKQMHLDYVAKMGVSHCAHANIDGGGQCP